MGLTETGNDNKLHSHVSSIGHYNVHYETGEGTLSGAALLVKDNNQLLVSEKT